MAAVVIVLGLMLATPAMASSERVRDDIVWPSAAGPSFDAGTPDAASGVDAATARADAAAAPDASEELPALDDGGDCTCRVGGASGSDPPYDMAAAGILFFAGLLFRKKK